MQKQIFALKHIRRSSHVCSPAHNMQANTAKQLQSNRHIIFNLITEAKAVYANQHIFLNGSRVAIVSLGTKQKNLSSRC
jgi:hypothetical protein